MTVFQLKYGFNIHCNQHLITTTEPRLKFHMFFGVSWLNKRLCLKKLIHPRSLKVVHEWYWTITSRVLDWLVRFWYGNDHFLRPYHWHVFRFKAFVAEFHHPLESISFPFFIATTLFFTSMCADNGNFLGKELILCSPSSLAWSVYWVVF